LILPPQATQSGGRTLKAQDATAVRLTLTETLSSATNSVDDPLYFELTEDVKIGDIVAIAKGSTAVGHVIEVEPRRRLGRAGKLNFAIDHVKAPDGANIRLRAPAIRWRQWRSLLSRKAPTSSSMANTPPARLHRSYYPPVTIRSPYKRVSSMADSLFEDSQFYAHNKMDQPDKMKILCSRAQDALKMAPASKVSADLDKKIQAAMKKAKA
jgi:hypothetical protein